MNVLVINAGSSSLKYQLIDMDTESVLAKGLCERIGIAGSNIAQKAGDREYALECPIPNHVEAMKRVVEALTDKERGVISDMSSIQAVGHRVVHGGERFSASVLIDGAVMEAVKDNVALAPLHNPANIQGIEACAAIMPGAPMVAVFDTAFHQTMPPVAYLYGLPYELYTDMRIRRYGFHGTSHGFVAQRAAQMLSRPAEELKLVTCHLGNGSSIAAVKGGKCVDTSMGLTPLEGVMMGTRSGDIDPAIIEYMVSQGVKLEDVMNTLNKKSGMLGLSGISSDMRDLQKAAGEGSKRARLTLDVFYYRIRKYIGAYAAAMGGIDALVFAAGIGENVPNARWGIVQGLEFLGVEVDEGTNAVTRADADISVPGARVRTLVISTNEELKIARETKALL